MMPTPSALKNFKAATQLKLAKSSANFPGALDSSPPKGWSYKGINLTLGEDGAWAGVLNRSIERVDKGTIQESAGKHTLHLMRI